jgi:Protein of unknown function (DUF3617)
MRKAVYLLCCLGIYAALLFGATGQPLNVKAGVWQVEYNIKYSGLSPQLQAMMDHMTPQQKAAMGIAAPKTYKMCVKEKDLNKSWTEGDDNCRWKIVKSTSSDLEIHGTACRAGDGEMDVKIHALDSEHVRATLHGTGNEQGSNVTINGDYTGKWMGAACPADLK